jgi:hypothetical protein
MLYLKVCGSTAAALWVSRYGEMPYPPGGASIDRSM